MNNNELNHSLILNTIAELLTNICDESTKDKDNNTSKLYIHITSIIGIIKPFLSKKVPAITIKNYLERLIKYTKIESTTLVLILIFIDRVCDINKIRLNYFNIHKLIIASMLVSIKYNEDDYFSNEFYAKVGGIRMTEMNKLEYEFLSLIEFNLFVNEEVFNKYNTYLISAHDDEDDNEEEEEKEEVINTDKV